MVAVISEGPFIGQYLISNPDKIESDVAAIVRVADLQPLPLLSSEIATILLHKASVHSRLLAKYSNSKVNIIQLTCSEILLQVACNFYTLEYISILY